jgi:hypothetical protein
MTAFQPGAGFLDRATGSDFGFWHLLAENPHDDGAGDLGSVDYQYVIQLLGHLEPGLL